MNERLKNYIDELFKNAPESPRTEEYKEEIYNNNLEKMKDLISEGMSENDAFNTVAAGMGDMSELFEALSFEGAAAPGISDSEKAPKKRKGLPPVAIVFIVIGAVLTGVFILLMLSYTALSTFAVIGRMPEVIEPNVVEALETDVETAVYNNSVAIGSGMVIEQQINTLDISWAAGSVVIGKSDSGKLVLREESGRSNEKPMVCSASAGTLSVRFKAVEAENMLSFKDPDPKTLYIYLPHGNISVKADTASADIAVEKGLDFGELEFFTTTGSITASDITAGGMFISSASGSVKLSDIFVSGDIDVETTSGNITVLDADCANMLYINTTTGDVRSENTSAEGMVIDHSSGSAILSGINAASLKTDAVSGDISLHAAKVNETDIDTVSGSVEINGLEGEKLNVETDSGSAGADNIVTSDMNINTSSGDIYLAGAVPEGAVIQTVGGQVVFTAADNICIRFRTESGNIVTDLPYKASNDGVTLFGKASDKKPVNVQTVSGDVLVQ